MTRLIAHVDLDAFFASVEQLDNPELQGLPVAVGGTGPRAVLAAASYEARKFGVSSAMPTARAQRLCPTLKVIPPRFARYRIISKQFFEALRTLTDRIEPISIDEGFCDFTGTSRLHGPPRQLGVHIKKIIHERTGLTASVGLAPTKHCAKIASGYEKPNGLTIVSQEEMLPFLHALPINNVWGIGQKTATTLHSLGIKNVGQLAAYPHLLLVKKLGEKTATHLLALANGYDSREVGERHGAKSISTERTFSVDPQTLPELSPVWSQFCLELSNRLESCGWKARTVSVKLRNQAFQTFQASHTVHQPIHSDLELLEHVRRLAKKISQKQAVFPVRLAGVGISNFTRPHSEQLALDLTTSSKRSVSPLANAVSKKFGPNMLVRGDSLLSKD